MTAYTISTTLDQDEPYDAAVRATRAALTAEPSIAAVLPCNVVVTAALASMGSSKGDI